MARLRRFASRHTTPLRNQPFEHSLKATPVVRERHLNQCRRIFRRDKPFSTRYRAASKPIPLDTPVMRTEFPLFSTLETPDVGNQHSKAETAMPERGHDLNGNCHLLNPFGILAKDGLRPVPPWQQPSRGKESTWVFRSRFLGRFHIPRSQAPTPLRRV